MSVIRTDANLTTAYGASNSVSWSGNSISWFNNTSGEQALPDDAQLNHNRSVYHYIVIG